MAPEELDQERPRDVEALLHLGVHLGVEVHLLGAIACRRLPTRRAGTTNAGSTMSASSVSRHSSAIIAATVVTSVTELLTAVPSVEVTALCAPITSLFSRLMRHRSACA